MKPKQIKWLAMTACLGVMSSAWSASEEGHVGEMFSGLTLRNIGPATTGGRIADIAVNPTNPAEYYLGVASGGVWKTQNAGITWQPLFDDQGSYSIGDVTLDPNQPHVVWVGTGENNSQRSVGYGDGVYKSVDGGKSWQNTGLKESEHIARILIDPRNSDVVYVAAQGPLWRAGGERGVYKSSDGGKTWQQSLAISEHTGVTDLLMDPRNPDVLYAASYQRRRHVWTLINGGPESTVYKSTDAGNSWQKANQGLPGGDVGRIGLALAPSQPDTLYAIVEAAEGQGLYRSDDAGGSWQKQSDYLSASPQYYQEIEVDPQDPDRLYSLDTYLMISEDGGKHFRRTGEQNKHVDNHAIWIDPRNTAHLLLGCDGGVYETWDRGTTWGFKDNLPITQFYRVTADDALPFYHVYGGTQDNYSLGAPHRTNNRHGIRNSDWTITLGGDGFESVIEPGNPDIIYSQAQYGWLARYDKQSGEKLMIRPMSPDVEEPQRWNWNSPLLISQHDPKRLYYASQRLFRSDDRGNQWQAISGDLSQNLDRNKLEVMDRVWGVDSVAKNQSTSFYGSLVTLSESLLLDGLLYTGSDDGVMHMTKDGGQQWRKLRWPRKVPEMSYVSDMEASKFDAKVVYASFDNHKRGDFKPYIYVSYDQGASWDSITGDLPQRGTVYALAQDHKKPELLFAGTEFGVFFTQNGGENWHQLKNGMPTIAVRDIDIQPREDDLVLATFGRGIYILDDYSPLRTLAETLDSQPATLLPVRRALQYVEANPLGGSGKGFHGANFYTADNPEYGALFSYYLKQPLSSLKQQRQQRESQRVEEEQPVYYPSWQQLREEDLEHAPAIILSVYDAEDNLIRRIKGSNRKGLQRVAWDLRYPGFAPIKADTTEQQLGSGPMVVPGRYRVVLSQLVNGVETELSEAQAFNVTPLNNVTFPSSERAADLQFDLKAGRLYATIQGTVAYVSELQQRIKLLQTALQHTPSAEQARLVTLVRAGQRLTELSYTLSGDNTVASRAEPTPESVVDDIAQLLSSRDNNTAAVNASQQARLARATQRFAQLHPQLLELANEVAKIESELQQSGAPWTPGRLPILPQ